MGMTKPSVSCQACNLTTTNGVNMSLQPEGLASSPGSHSFHPIVTFDRSKVIHGIIVQKEESLQAERSRCLESLLFLP